MSDRYKKATAIGATALALGILSAGIAFISTTSPIVGFMIGCMIGGPGILFIYGRTIH